MGEIKRSPKYCSSQAFFWVINFCSFNTCKLLSVVLIAIALSCASAVLCTIALKRYKKFTIIRDSLQLQLSRYDELGLVLPSLCDRIL